MEEWFSKYAVITPWGILAFTLLFWSVDGHESLSELATFVDLGLITYLAFIVVLDRVVGKLFYYIAQKKKQQHAEAEKRVLKLMRQLARESAGSDDEAEVLQRFIERVQEEGATTRP